METLREEYADTIIQSPEKHLPKALGSSLAAKREEFLRFLFVVQNNGSEAGSKWAPPG